MDKKTSWREQADWYDDLIEKQEDNYQKTLILPNLLRLLAPSPGESVLDLASGQGFFSRELAKLGVKVLGVDASPELIKIARERDPKIKYILGNAFKLDFSADKSFDKAIAILAIQNIEKANETFKEVFRVLKPGGKFYMVLNHPAFRIPKKTSWVFDDEHNAQYRRVDAYLSESTEKIYMHPGDRPEEFTLSFHRPLQFYFKGMTNAGFLISRIEEWSSNKKSQPGKRSEAENVARKEIPLFIMIEAVKSLLK